MKNFGIALNAGTPIQRNDITNLLSKKNWAFWHWMDDFWIVKVPDNYTPRTLHDELEELPDIKKPTMLIFEFQGSIKYWGRNIDVSWDWLGHIGSQE